jgi:hypothetical protein
MKKLLRLGVAAVFLSLAMEGSAACAQTQEVKPAAAALGPADTYFVTQTSLGTPFQVDSGQIAATKGTAELFAPIGNSW